MNFFNTAIERMGRKVDNLTTENEVLKKKIAYLKSLIQFHSATTNQKFLAVDTKISQVYVVSDENIKTLIDNNKNLHMMVRDLEDRNRRNNLRFDGLSQVQREDWHGREAKIKNLIKKKLGINNVEIKSAHRMGIKERDDPSQKRTIIAMFLNCKDKERVMRDYRSWKIWEESLHINEEFSEETMEIRK